MEEKKQYTLTLKNFRCWEDKTIEIPMEGICLLSGRSGRGKSTIFNAMMYVITGKGKNITTFGKKSTYVELSFDDVDGCHHIIKRTRCPNLLLLQKGDKEYQDDEAQAIIYKYFGDEFCNTSYIDQDNNHSFVFLSPSEKMEFLETLLLHHYKIDDMKEKIKDEITKTKFDQTSTDSQYSTLSSLIKKITYTPQNPLIVDKVKISSTNVDKILEKLKKNMDVSEKNTKTYSQKIKKAEQEFISYTRLTENKQTVTNVLEDVHTQLSSLPSLESIVNELANIEKGKNNYHSMKNYAQYIDLEEKINKIKENNEKQKESLLKEVIDIPSYEKCLKTFQHLKKCDDMINTLVELDDKIQANNIDQYTSKIDDLSLLLSKKQEELYSTQKIVKEWNTCYKCPSCTKSLKFYEEKLVLIENNENNENKDKFIEKQDSLKKELISMTRELDELKKRQTVYESDLNEYNQKFDRLEEMLFLPSTKTPFTQDEVESLLITYQEYISLHEKVKKEMLSIENDRLYLQYCKEMELLSKKIDITKIEKNIEKEIITDQEYAELCEKYGQCKEVMEKVRGLTMKQTMYEKEWKVLEEKEKNMNTSNVEEDLKIFRENMEECIKKVDKYREWIQSINDWLVIEKENTKYMEMENQIIQLKEEKDRLMKRLGGLVKLRDHLKNAEQKSLSSFIDSLNRHASIYIEEFFPDEDIFVELKAIQEGKTTGKEKITLHFDVNYREMNGDLSFLSGGEKDRVNLAFTLAFSELVHTNMLLLDECISSLDNETTNVVLEHLHEKYKGKMMLIVSHQANSGFFDHVIDV